MSIPQMPDISSDRESAINALITSIAMEELAVAHILNAEGEKLQYFIGALEENFPDVITICDILAINKSIQETMREARKTERVLHFKLESALELDKNGDEE